MARGRSRVVVSSSSTLFRQGLESMLSESPRVELIGMTGLWDTALNLVKRHQPDVVVVDKDDRVPDSFLDDLFAAATDIRVVLLSLQSDELTVLTRTSVSHPRRPQLLAAVLHQSRGRTSAVASQA